MEAPEYLQTSFCPQFNSDNKINANGGEHFRVDDLLDFSNDDAIFTDETYDSVTPGNSTEGSTVTAMGNSCNSSSFSGCEPNFAANFSFAGDQFSGDLVVPCDDLAELEWLSNFVEESFSSEDMQKVQLISGVKAREEVDGSEICRFQPEPNRSNAPFNPELSVPAKARSKRSRPSACSWASRLLVLSSTAPSSKDEFVPFHQSASTVKKTATKTGMHRKKDSGDGSSSDGRRCLHCSTDKTPQWRTGPMGPKTLCNACGVRYKSGRLVPEYRPAASPTFMLTKHSNSHRKVMELRRQKEMLGAQPLQHSNHQQLLQQEAKMFDASNGNEYLIHQHVGPDIGHLI